MECPWYEKLHLVVTVLELDTEFGVTTSFTLNWSGGTCYVPIYETNRSIRELFVSDGNT